MRDIRSGKDAQVAAVVAVIARTHPDILVLTGIDYDHDLRALSELADLVEAVGGPDYAHLYARRPNSGMASGLDLDDDGRLGGPGDAQGFGMFSGQGGMAILSRLPVDGAAVQDFSAFLWRDLPDALIEGAGLSPDAVATLRLSSVGHWAVPMKLPDGRRLTILAYHATPPVFDGPEDRNGRRNHDETAFWTGLLDGELPFAPPQPPFVIVGDANLDPLDGDGRAAALAALLADARLHDPAPKSAGGPEASARQGGVNAAQQGDPALDTADWPEDGPGNRRVDYVLPSADLTVTAAGVHWPAEGQDGAEAATAASRHRLVWVDIDLP